MFGLPAGPAYSGPGHPVPKTNLNTVRIATWLAPPLGLFLLWRSSTVSLGRKLFGTLGILLYCLPYTALIIFLLVRTTGLQSEWRGGYVPAFTYRVTAPDFARLEAHRRQQPSSTSKSPASTNQSYWTGFRGPGRDGRSEEQPILTAWPASGLPLLWRQPCGGGYGSFAIARGLAFTLEQRRENEVTVAYDIETGREIWTNGWAGHFSESMGGDGPRSTPTYHDGLVYVLGGEGEFRCLNAVDGTTVWRKNILTEYSAPNLFYAESASPLVIDGKVILTPGGFPKNSVVACDRLTGKTLWHSLGDPTAYSSPMLVRLAGQMQILTVTESRAVGLSVEDGKLLWQFPWVVQLKNRNVAQPVVLSSNRFLLSAGYFTGCAAIEVSPGPTGFITQEVWRNKFLKNKFTSSVFLDGFVYGLDEDILVCLDAQSGERRWKGGRYGYGQVLLAGHHLVILTGDGQLALVKAQPERHEEISRFQAIEGKTWNHPAIDHGRIFVRNAAEMACFKIAP